MLSLGGLRALSRLHGDYVPLLLLKVIMQYTNKDSRPKSTDNLAGSLLHGLGFLLVVDVIALALGFAFFLIAHGILMSLLRIAPYWRPAGKVFQRVFDQSNSPETAVRFPIRGYHAFRFIRSAALWVVFIGIGVWMLIQNGFCTQNIICIIVNR